METMEMPMTQGVSQTIDTQELEVRSLELEQESENSNEELRGSMHESQTIDSLLEHAAEEGTGFEDILEKIAEGEFEEESSEGKAETEVQTEADDEIVEEEMLDEDVTMSSEEFQVLEEKMDTVIENTKEILEKQDTASPEIRMSSKEFFDMILAMYLLAKQEKSKKRKSSMFLFLINLIGTFMQSIADPESLDKKVESMKTAELEEEEPDEDNLIDMVKYLEKNKMLNVA